MLATSCPSCGTEARPRAPRCESCGFVFFEKRERRRFAPPPLLPLALLALSVALTGGAVVLLGRDEPAAAPSAPEPVAAAKAERRLESRFAGAGHDDTAAVRCRRAVRLGGATRCQVRYANGDTQLILAGLDGRGDLDVTIPYPAQRRPGD